MPPQEAEGRRRAFEVVAQLSGLQGRQVGRVIFQRRAIPKVKPLLVQGDERALVKDRWMVCVPGGQFLLQGAQFIQAVRAVPHRE